MIWLVAFLSCVGLIGAEEPFNHNVHNERVIGGYDAEPNKWKWQISLQLDSYNDGSFYHICGGTLISASDVMTAAHCILSMDPNQYRVVVGEYNLYEYDGSEENDMAILRLANPVYNNGYVAIAELPYPGEKLPHNFACYITGWGLIDYYGTVPAILQEAPINVVEHSVCSQPTWWGSLALETMVCAGGDGIISGCQGDSGGPLHCNVDGTWRVHGVVSYGPSGQCNQVTKPTVFTRVSSFLDWIYSVSSSY
ncbi:hypothetical protein INR49_014845 [Caranx melampygus]|nr:hypothetical protein INR49_014845 [Caranx melampygus]